MNYTLYHGEFPVCELHCNNKHRIESITRIFDTERLPPGIRRQPKPDAFELNEWFFRRGISAQRDGIDIILSKEGAESVNELILQNKGLSLSDHYWVKKQGDNSEWGAVNFYDNNFGKTGEDIYIGEYEEKVGGEITPNGVSNGNLPKKWIIKDGKRYLLKGSESALAEEPYHEIIASCFCEKTGITHVNYELAAYKGKTYCVCQNMLQKNEELIPAYYVSQEKTKAKETSHYEHYIECCGIFGLKAIRQKLEKMIVLDYLIANTDRHWGNFGIIRDAKTLEAIRLAPLYDHGAAFFAKMVNEEISAKNSYLRCQSFKSLQHDNLKLVTNLEWLNTTAVKELPELTRELLSKNGQISVKRLDAVTTGIIDRIKFFEKERKLSVFEPSKKKSTTFKR
ncbi:hypothetical protein AGMMS50230_08600 [Spirochaetia bacterium]|nr:hypothetical protein AGMMS50230_08600 [Spirochaetia bacterium]